MKIRDALTIINRMLSEGIITQYAIGGAVGATFFLEPVSTIDLDIFIGFKASEGRLISLKPIYDYLASLGCTTQGEYVIIEGWPVQFLPPAGTLVEEALENAIQTDVDGVSTYVFSAEYLAAIALQTGRPKDKIRLLQFHESGILDNQKFLDIISRYSLQNQWETFKSTILGDGK